MTSLTIEAIVEACHTVERAVAIPHINSLRITVSPYALKETAERLFPASRNRSKRIRKKLVKRFGGEFRRVPTIFQTPQGFICHPALYAEMRKILEDRP